jgi:acyl-CoA synthetase (AMP-forming)/AMP-acid ligase II
VQTAFRTLVESLLFEAKTHGLERGITFIADDGSELRVLYAHMLDRALGTAGRLREEGVRAGERVLLVLPTEPRFLDVFLGAMLLGAVPCALAPPMGIGGADAFVSRAAAVVDELDARAVVTSGSLAPMLAAALPAPCRVLDAASVEGGEHPPAHLAEPGDAAFVQLTSGSTRRARAVVISHEAVLANIHQIGWALKLRPTDVHVSWLPLYHDMGLVGAVLFSVYWNLDVVLMTPFRFLRKPSAWLEAISRFRGTLSTAPNFGYAYATGRVRDEEIEGLDLSSWRHALCGAEPIDAGVLRRFRERFRRVGFPERAYVPCYGLAEATLAVSFHRVGAPLEVDRVSRAALATGRAEPVGPGSADALEIVSCGRPLIEMDVRILGEGGAEKREREVGEVVVGGPTLLTEYLGRPAETLSRLERGGIRTGDLGYKAGGRLFITGREKDLIIVRGRNHYPQDLEWAAHAVPGVRAGSVCAFGIPDPRTGTEQAAIVAETDTTDDAELRRLRRAITERVAARTGLAPARVELVPRHTIPKTSSGKIQRRRCRAMLLARLGG